MNPMMQNFLDALIRPEKRYYVLQNAHCGHIALVSGRRASIETAHRIAFAKRMHAWRVRVEPANPPKGTCDNCKREVKVLGLKPRSKALVSA